jgi:hypothetical protein
MKTPRAFRRTDSADITPMPVSSARLRSLTVLLRAASAGEADVLHPLFARVLRAHMDAPHNDAAANVRIRDALDEIELLLALEIERAGLREELMQPAVAGR